MERYWEASVKTRKLHAAAIAIVTSLSVWASLSAYSDKDVPDPQFLASDLFFRLDEFVFSIPAVALRDIETIRGDASTLPKYRSNPRPFGKPRWFATNEYKAALRDLAGSQENPARIQSIKINLGVYGTFGEYSVSQQICPLLSKEWSQKACVNELRHEQRRLPVDFTLSTTLGLPVDQDVTLSTQSKVFAADMTLFCGEGSARCRVTIAISENLHATWSSVCQNANAEYCLQERRAEGLAISGFVRNQIGKIS
ncbi:hypothetical protein [uncultured Tateyamaria sp.]|uniref:hypothetical protein n=1 Tax=uncultured Tateyamaria sp. TaxID=455651 RepID=UPI00260A03F2|nr:hypothetical protein [uncultured Tateyamaria sp.]